MIMFFALLATYKSPTIPLSEICERYFHLSYDEALRKAMHHQLPVPTFRLTSSRKAPIMVSAWALGEWIEKVEEDAKTVWERSQI